jgi:hypothetical protein
VTARPITTIVSDFGGVLSTPLRPAFAAVQAHLGLPSDALGAAMAAAGHERGVSLLAELECGRMAEPTSSPARRPARGRPRPARRHARVPRSLLGGAAPNAELIAHLPACARRATGWGAADEQRREWEPRWRPMLPSTSSSTPCDSAFVGLASRIRRSTR